MKVLIKSTCPKTGELVYKHGKKHLAAFCHIFEAYNVSERVMKVLLTMLNNKSIDHHAFDSLKDLGMWVPGTRGCSCIRVTAVYTRTSMQIGYSMYQLGYNRCELGY